MDLNIQEREQKLRNWFVRDCLPIYQIIDGFDIGWGGTAQFATKKIIETMKMNLNPRILDIASGYGTFLAELGWYFPNAYLYGLNLDFDPPHNIIFTLLKEAEVKTSLFIADSIKLPFKRHSMDIVTCFIGLQDILITRGYDGVIKTIEEMLRVINHSGIVVLIDNFEPNTFLDYIQKANVQTKIVSIFSFEPDCQWSHEIGEEVIKLYAEGTLKQQLLQVKPPKDKSKAFQEIYTKMKRDLDQQLSEKGYYNPWQQMSIIMLKLDI